MENKTSSFKTTHTRMHARTHATIKHSLRTCVEGSAYGRITYIHLAEVTVACGCKNVLFSTVLCNYKDTNVIYKNIARYYDDIYLG